MPANNTWMYQGRQYHQWFGHGTAPKGGASQEGFLDPRNVAQRIGYAVGSVVGSAPKNERSRWEARLGGAGRDSLETVIAAWHGARGMGKEAFQALLMPLGTPDGTAGRLRQAASGIVEARTHEQLGGAAKLLAAGAFQVGLDAWPRFLGDSQRRAVEAASLGAVPGVTKASAAGTDAALAGGVLLGGLALYLANRRQPLSDAARAGRRVDTAPALGVFETAVPLPPQSDGETPADVLKPGGQNVGRPGENSGVRVLPGQDEGARELFDRLAQGGTNIAPPGHGGKVVRRPDGGTIGYLQAQVEKRPADG